MRAMVIAHRIDRVQHLAEERIRELRVEPAHDQRDASLRLDPHERTARADAEVTRFRHARKHAATRVEPHQIPVVRRERAGRLHPRDPFGRQHAASVGDAAVEQHLRNFQLIVRAHRHAAAPVRTARHRLDARTVDVDPRVVIADPLPVLARADGPHDGLAKHLGQGLAEQMQQREGQLVDTHVVVFPVRAGRLQRAQIALFAVGRIAERHGAIVIGLIGQAEALALPFARLLQQLRPRNGRIVRIVEADAGHTHAHRFVRIGQQAAIVRDACQQREVGLGDAERQVGAIRFAPCREQPAIDGDRARHRPAVMDRPEQPVPRRRIVHMHAELAVGVAVPRRFVVDRKLDSVADVLRQIVLHTCLFLADGFDSM